MTIHPQAQEVLDLLQTFGVSQLSDLSVEESRNLFVAMAAERPGPDVAEVRPVSIPGPEGDIAMRLYRPAGSSPSEVLPVLVYFHGGGWVIGNLDSHDGTARWLANRAGIAVASVDYRLAPEHVFPAGVDDCWAATTWIAGAGAEQLGIDPTRVVVGGDSAGGNIAAVMALMARDAGGPEIRLQALVYPAVDAHMAHPSIDENGNGYLLSKADMAWFYAHYGVGRVVDADEWRLSPLLNPSLAGVAPACVVTAEFDPLRDEGEAYVAALEAAGVAVQHRRFDGMIHGFFTMVGAIDAAEEAQEQVAKAITTAVG